MLYLPLGKLYPNTQWPKNGDEIRELLGIDMEYYVDEDEESEYFGKKSFSTWFPNLGLSISIDADGDGLVPGDYSIILKNMNS